MAEWYLSNPRPFEGNSPRDAGENYTTGTRIHCKPAVLFCSSVWFLTTRRCLKWMVTQGIIHLVVMVMLTLCNQDFINLETQLNIRICIHVMITHHFQAGQCIRDIVHWKWHTITSNVRQDNEYTTRDERSYWWPCIPCRKIEESASPKYSSACSSSPETEKKRVSPQLSVSNVKVFNANKCSITEVSCINSW